MPTAPKIGNAGCAIGIVEINRQSVANPNAKFIYILRNPITRTHSDYWHEVRYGYKDIGFRKALEVSPAFLDNSDYMGQIKNYLEFFSLDAFLFIVFEEMIKSPENMARKCFAFLGLDDEFTPTFERPKNESFRYNRIGRILRSVVSSGDAMNKLVNMGQRLTPRFLEPMAKRLITSGVPSLDDHDRDYLETYFKDKNAELARVTGIDVSCWRT